MIVVAINFNSLMNEAKTSINWAYKVVGLAKVCGMSTKEPN